MRLRHFLPNLSLSALLGFAPFSPVTAGELSRSFEVVVFGGTPGGITPAIAAAREGASVAVVEPSKHIGGMVAGGLSRTDYSNQQIIGGIAREFFTRADAMYNDPQKTNSPNFWNSEPKVAEQAFHDMLKEAGI